MKKTYLLITLALLTGGTVLGAVPTLREVHPFYERLMREGTDAYRRGDLPAAKRSLRLAVFGLLDEPEMLAEGLTWLALSQAKTGAEEEFRETVLRVLELEVRFKAYRAAEIAPEMRREFENLVTQRMPRSTLEASPIFTEIADRQAAERLQSLSRRERRSELERLLESQPGNARWRLMLARAELEDGRNDAAIRNASILLDMIPGMSDGLLVRGLAFAREKRWDAAADDLTASNKARENPEAAKALLEALIELERWEPATNFLATLPVEIRADRQIQEMASQIYSRKN
jgi:thioredoxin-like negative regulator of GroEL